MNERSMWADVWRFYLIVKNASTDRQYESASKSMGQISVKYKSELCDALLCAIWASKGDETN